MTLRIVTSDEILWEGEIEQVTLPGVEGAFTILPHHAPLISLLGEGTIRFVKKGETKHEERPLHKGWVKVEWDKIDVFCDE